MLLLLLHTIGSLLAYVAALFVSVFADSSAFVAEKPRCETDNLEIAGSKRIHSKVLLIRGLFLLAQHGVFYWSIFTLANVSVLANLHANLQLKVRKRFYGRKRSTEFSDHSLKKTAIFFFISLLFFLRSEIKRADAKL